ncbi:MAG: glycosyltransferase family 2 protein [Candidatus Riflebacteria bacterium]|nr:glycosyltransferase family 2 protein [Candidatus Riflebacteria bacterium]
MPNPTLSVVVPVFNEEAVLPKLEERLRSVLDGARIDFEVILVDDGSRDSSRTLLRELNGRDPRFKVVGFSRNFGHQLAVTAGLEAATGQAVAILDADLQDPPEVLLQMLELYHRGFDVIGGVRTARHGENAMKLATAAVFYRLLRAITRLDIPADAGDFRLLSRRAVDALLQLPERHRFVRGLASWIGFRQTTVQYERAARAAGDTHYPYRKMLAFAFDGLTSFSIFPLQLASYLGIVVSLLSFALLTWAVWLKLFTDRSVQGWASIVVAITFLGGVQLIFLGVIGEYIGRIYDEVKRRPLYLVEERIGFEDGTCASVRGGASRSAARVERNPEEPA